MYPDMFSLAQAHEAFAADGTLANDLLQKRFDDTTALLAAHGMAGLMARFTEGPKLSMPYYDDVVIKAIGGPTPAPTVPASSRPGN